MSIFVNTNTVFLNNLTCALRLRSSHYMFLGVEFMSRNMKSCNFKRFVLYVNSSGRKRMYSLANRTSSTRGEFTMTKIQLTCFESYRKNWVSVSNEICSLITLKASYVFLSLER